jgi:hypothetical protein
MVKIILYQWNGKPYDRKNTGRTGSRKHEEEIKYHTNNTYS